MEEYISKVDLKKRLGIHEAELIELVEKGILPFYLQKPDGTFQQIPLKVQDQKPAHRMDAADRPYTTKKTYYRCPTKEEITKMLGQPVCFRRADIEDAKYAGRLAIPESTVTTVTTTQAAGSVGGKMKTRNPAIAEAIKIFFSNDPKILYKPDEKIMDRFKRKFTPTHPCSFELDGNTCEVYCDGDKIHSSIGGKDRKSLRKSTVQRFYLPAAKKTILQQKSNNPS